MLAKNSYFSKSPELEFFRHLRNGVAHNNKFTFSAKEPIRQASFRGFSIDKTLEGRDVLYRVGGDSFVDEGDILDLFDEIETQLRGN